MLVFLWLQLNAIGKDIAAGLHCFHLFGMRDKFSRQPSYILGVLCPHVCEHDCIGTMLQQVVVDMLVVNQANPGRLSGSGCTTGIVK